MNADTNFYLQALAEFQRNNPRKRRECDLTLQDRSQILRDAQELKKPTNHASREEQNARYIDCGPAAWDDR